MSTFTDLGVPENLAATLEATGISEPFPIQTKTLPDSLDGRDVLGRGRTGSGKTLAFSLPLVARLANDADRATLKPSRPRGLVLAPTRELATQINATLEPLAKAAGLRTTVIFGGVSQKRQEIALRAGVDIVVACPGRLEDLQRQRVIDLSGVEITVLDEADHMADLGFLPGVKRILDSTPSGGQRMLFSATLDNGVDVLVKRYLDQPVVHSVDESQAAVSTMEHRVFFVDPAQKKDLVQKLASGVGRRVMFMRTKHHAKKMAKQLTMAGIPAVDLHGNLSQNARDRNLAAFSSGEVKVLVATDVAARGVHVDDVELVVHIDPPTEHKAYLHRSGRTARAGSSGTVVTVVLPDQRKDVRSLLKAAGVDAQLEEVTPKSDAVREVVGEVADHVAPQPKVSPQRTTGSSSARRKRVAQSRTEQGRGGRGAANDDGARPSRNRNDDAPGNRGGRRRGARDDGGRPAGDGAGNRGGRGRRRGGAGDGAARSNESSTSRGSDRNNARDDRRDDRTGSGRSERSGARRDDRGGSSRSNRTEPGQSQSGGRSASRNSSAQGSTQRGGASSGAGARGGQAPSGGGRRRRPRRADSPSTNSGR